MGPGHTFTLASTSSALRTTTPIRARLHDDDCGLFQVGTRCDTDTGKVMFLATEFNTCSEEQVQLKVHHRLVDDAGNGPGLGIVRARLRQQG